MSIYDDYVLHDYLDDELDPASREALDEALRQDLTLRRRLSELERLRAELADLPREAVVPARVWDGIAARLDDDRESEDDPQVIRLTPAAPAGGTPERRFSFTVPQLAAAALVLVSLGSALTWAARSDGPPTMGPAAADGVSPAAATAPIRSPGDVLFAEYEASADELLEIVEAGDSLLSEETLAVLRQSLEAIDEAVEEALTALDDDPGSEMLLRILQSNMEKKIDLLRHTAQAVQEIA